MRRVCDSLHACMTDTYVMQVLLLSIVEEAAFWVELYVRWRRSWLVARVGRGTARVRARWRVGVVHAHGSDVRELRHGGRQGRSEGRQELEETLWTATIYTAW